VDCPFFILFWDEIPRLARDPKLAHPQKASCLKKAGYLFNIPPASKGFNRTAIKLEPEFSKSFC
jgi:hypothetical protein